MGKIKRSSLVYVVVALTLVLVMSTVFACAKKATPTPAGTATPVATATPTATPAQIVWKLQNSYVGTADVWGRTFTEWLNSTTGGRLKIEILPADALAPTATLHTAISKGAVTGAAVHYAGYYTAEIPEADIDTGLPGMYQTVEEWWEIHQLRGVGKILRDVYAKRNIYYIGIPCDLIYSLATNYPIQSFSDVKGKKIRALGSWGEWVKALGGSTTSVPWGEMYTGMQLKTIDGYITGMGILKDQKMWEVTSHIIVDPNPSIIGADILINMDALNALPADIKQLIQSQSSANTLPGSMWYHQEITRILMQARDKYGAKLVTVPADKSAIDMAAAMPLWDTVASRSPECAQMVTIIKDYYKEMGKLK